MKTVIDEPLHIQITPDIFVDDETEEAGAQFTWGIFKDNQTNTSTSEQLIQIHLMRMFACQTIRQLLRGEEKVHQDVYHNINFKLPDDVKEFMNTVIIQLEQEILSEIFFQKNPIKPTKSNLNPLSLFPKQETNISNEQERTEITE